MKKYKFKQSKFNSIFTNSLNLLAFSFCPMNSQTLDKFVSFDNLHLTDLKNIILLLCDPPFF